MRRFIPSLILLTLATACESATEPADAPMPNAPALSAAGAPVDPAALTPAPSQVGATATCHAAGPWIICHTRLVIKIANEPTGFGLSCGEIYETSRDVRLGIRYYSAADSILRHRHVEQNVEGTWSLSPTGAGPTARLTIHAAWNDRNYADLNDLDSGVRFSHGTTKVTAPGYGVIGIISGRDDPDGTHHGPNRGIDKPAVAAKLCSALSR